MWDGDIELRAFRDDDEKVIAALLAEPAVRRWWADGDYDAQHGWIVEIGGAIAGWIEYREETHKSFPSVSLDIALTSALHGHGYGRRVLRLVIEHFVAKGHHRFTIDPNVENLRAIRCYTAVGFKPVGVLRAYELNPAGGWKNGLLMDLIVLEGEWR